jgi:hypothetical protein
MCITYLFLGARSFQRGCLHHIGHEQNPYEQAISIIEMAITIVEQSEGQYHVLLIIADGQVENYQS